MAAAVVALAGILIGVTAASRVGIQPETGEDTLALAIFVNRLDLTTEQMQLARDRITDVLAAVDEIDEQRNAFVNEMIEFNGTQEELDERLLAFRERMGVAVPSLQETIRGAVEELKDTLTIRQGEVIARFLHEIGIVRDRRTSGQSMPRGRGELLGVLREHGEGGLGVVLQAIRDRIAGAVHEGVRPMQERERPCFFDPDRMRERMMDRPFAELPNEMDPIEADPLEVGDRIAEAIRERIRDASQDIRPAPFEMRRGRGHGAGLPEPVVDLLRQLRDILDTKLALRTSG
jgi:hypothetical protein